MAVCAVSGCRGSHPVPERSDVGSRPMITRFVSPVGSGPRYRHRVARGETLAAVADRYGVDLVSLATENRLALGAALNPGAKLTLPADARVVHVLRRGETLSHLAVWYRLPVERIAAANGIDDPRALDAGAEIWIPPGAGRVPVAQPQLAAGPAATPKAPVDARLSAAERLLVDGEANYWAADFDAALRSAVASQTKASNARPSAQRDRLLARAALLEGMVQTAQGDAGAAQRAFEKALRFDADLHLDPLTTSPKILRAFDIARFGVGLANGEESAIAREP